MIRILVYLLILALVAFGADWLLQQPGHVEIVWDGYHASMTAAVGFGLIVLAAITLSVFWGLVRFLFGLPSFVALARRQRRREKGYAALSRGLIAAGAGDARGANKASILARKHLKDDPLAIVLQATAARLLGDGAAAEGFRLLAVSEVLEIKPHLGAGTHAETVQGLCQRIDGLIRNGNFDTAERVADTGLNEFPANADLAVRREKARQAAGRRPPASRESAAPDEPLSPDEIALRQTLLRLVALDATGDIAEALNTLHEAMERLPDRTAFRIAEAYLEAKAGEGKK